MSTTGKGAPNLATSQGKGTNQHVAGTDEATTDPQVNPFQNVAWKRIINNVEEEIMYSPVTVQYGYNGVEHVFELQKIGGYQGQFYLMYRRSQINWQNPDANGSYARFHDFEGYSSIDKVVYTYMNKDIIIQSGEDMYWDMVSSRKAKFIAQKKREQQCDSHLQAAMLEKNSALSSGRWVFVDLMSPFAKLRKHLPVVGFPSKIKVRVYFKPLQQCLVTDYTAGTPDVKIHEMYMYTNAYHLPPALTNMVFNGVQNSGYAIMMNTQEYENDNLFIAQPDPLNPSKCAEQTWSIDIRSIKNYVFEIRIIVRPISAVKPVGYSNTLYLWESIVTPDQWWFEDQGSEVTKKYDGRADMGSRAMKDHQNAHPDSHIFIPSMFFTINTENSSSTEASEDNSFGGRQLNRYTNLKLKLHFKAGNSGLVPQQQYHVNVIGKIHNQIMVTKGDLRRYLL